MSNENVSRTLLMIDKMSQGASLEELLKQTTPMKTLPQILLPKLGDMSLDSLAVYAGCSRANIYKIMGGKSHPEKDMLLRIAFVLRMEVEDMQQMLKSARRSPLSSGSPRDVCILYGLMNRLTLDEMDEVLEKKNFETLWPQG